MNIQSKTTYSLEMDDILGVIANYMTGIIGKTILSSDIKLNVKEITEQSRGLQKITFLILAQVSLLLF